MKTGLWRLCFNEFKNLSYRCLFLDPSSSLHWEPGNWSQPHVTTERIFVYFTTHLAIFIQFCRLSAEVTLQNLTQATEKTILILARRRTEICLENNCMVSNILNLTYEIYRDTLQTAYRLPGTQSCFCLLPKLRSQREGKTCLMKSTPITPLAYLLSVCKRQIFPKSN